MSRTQNADQSIALLESLSDISVTVVSDFFAGKTACGGLPVALRLAELGVTVFPVGVAGEDEGGQQLLQQLHEYRVSTSGISRVKLYRTPTSEPEELIHDEHPALLNLIEHARKFAAASEAMFVCDHGIGGATPRVLNFIKSNSCVREKTLAARSVRRIADFEQLTTAITSEEEMERAIGIGINRDPKKLAIAGQGMVEGMKLQSLLAISHDGAWVFEGKHKPKPFAISPGPTAGIVDVLGAIYTASLATGAEVALAADTAVRVSNAIASRPLEKRMKRDELLNAIASAKAPGRAR